MRRYHAGPAFPGSFFPFATVRTYHRLALEYGVTFPDTLPPVFTLMAQIEAALGRSSKSSPAITTCSPATSSTMAAPSGLLDWEYAGMGDLFFDLGNFAVNQSLNVEQCELLLRHYFGDARPADMARLHLIGLALICANRSGIFAAGRFRTQLRLS